MSTTTSKACWPIGNIQLRAALDPFVGVRGYSQASQRKLPSHFPRLPRTQLLRYALTGSTRSPGSNEYSPILDEELKELFLSRRLPKRLGETNSHLQTRSTDFQIPTKNGNTLSKIQSEIQIKVKDQESGSQLINSLPLFREALAQCESRMQWEDLLATINGTLARLYKFEVTNTKQLLFLGMRYAARCLFVPALRHYFKQYSEGEYGRLSSAMANQLVDDLLQGLKMRILDDPSMDISQIRQIITDNNGDDSDSGTLHSLLEISFPSESLFLAAYVTLLGQLGDQKRLPEIWSLIRAELIRDPTKEALNNAAVCCLQAFVGSGKPQAAIEAARDISHYLDLNSLLPVHLWTLLIRHDNNGVLRGLASDETTKSVLAGELCAIELAMGIRWTGKEDGEHSRTRDTPVWCNSGNPEEAYELLGTSNAVPAVSHLLDIFGTPTLMKSIAGLSALTDLLNEYEGVEIPLCTVQGDQFDQLELTWIMQCSPIEISQNCQTATQQVNPSLQDSSLGLLRVRQDCNGIPRKVGPHLHVMQVGYVAVRRKAIVNGSGPSMPGEPKRWIPTGHIVGWDRQDNRLVLLWTGKGYGTLNAGLLHPKTPSYFPYSGVVVGNLVELKRSSELDVAGLGLVEIFKDVEGFWVDVDPAFDLRS
ncbi:hypothetical protein PRK78_007249 [Emydomyces testavorans]|uniref:Uncharacterized protein n=1 Tax=Emydomyces testavorans TaxID=2070801 RepID=A0AAF0DMV5_9EURO|nr:hypothetical protein PRK78_007249 [Emydomyces testavorans]